MSKVQVDKVVNLSDDGAPQLTYGAELPVGYGLTGAGGLNISGVVTAASAVFSGNVTIGGTLTYEDVTNIDAVGVITAQSGVNISGGEFKVGTAVTVGSVGVSTFTKNVNIEGNVAIGLKGATASSLTPVLQLHKKASSSTSYLHITNTDSGVTNNDGFVIGFNGSNDALIFNKESTPIRFATAGAEQMRIAADGKVGIDSTAPNYQLDVANSVGTATTIFINATNQAQNTASRAELRLGYSHSGGKAVGYVRLDEAATNSFDGNITVGVPYNNSGGGSSTWEPIKIVGGSAGADIRISGSASGITSVTWDASANSLIFRDNSKAVFGDSSDLKIYHDSNNTRIDNNTGQLKLRALNSGASIQLIDHNDTAMLQAVAGGTVSIAHNNSTKIATTTTGVSVTGTAAASAFGQSTTLTNTASVSDHYWKIGEATMNGSEGFIIHFNTGQGYSDGAEAAVHTTCVARANNATGLEGYWHSTSMSGAAGVKDIRWKYTGANNIYEIWVKGNQYANLTPIVDIFGGSWTSFNSNTGSSSAPASSTAFNNGTHYTQVDGYNTIQYNQQNTTFLQNIHMASGKGINFHPQGGSDVNLLDDYEEGVWTPVDSSGASLSFSNTSGNCHYTKTGRTVVASFRFTYPSTSNGTATKIGGLPFNCLSTTVNVSGAIITETSDSSSATIITDMNAATMIILHCNSGVDHRTNAEVSGKDYRGVVVYQST